MTENDARPGRQYIGAWGFIPAPCAGKTVLQHTENIPGMRRKFPNRSRLCFAVAGILSAAALASADPGYLPRVGPASLRFRPAPQPATGHFVLPPLEVAPEPPPVAVTPAAKPTAPAVTNSAATETTVISSEIPAAPEPARADDVVSPQMLMRFFSKSTNGTATSVIAPIQFTPPKAETPPSKAAFTTGP